MFDPIAGSMNALSHQAPYAPLLISIAGAATSIGPCTAPRLVAAAGVVSGSAGFRWSRTIALVAGLAAAYALFGVAASAFAGAFAYSTLVFIALAAVLAITGVRALLNSSTDGGSCAHAAKNCRSLGGTFLLGASFAFVVSPCCTPVVAAVLAYTGSSGNPGYGALCLAAFALGHAMPIFAFAAGRGAVSTLLPRKQLGESAATINGSMMIALAAYYGLLA